MSSSTRAWHARRWARAFFRSTDAAINSATSSMSSTVQRNLPPMPLNGTSFSAPSHTNSVSETLAQFQLGDAIGLAASRSGLSHKQLCAYMDNLDRGTWSKQLDGDGHVSLGRLLKCPAAFWLEFLPLLADHFGVRVVEHGAGMGPSIARALIVMSDVIARLELHAEQQTRRVG